MSSPDEEEGQEDYPWDFYTGLAGTYCHDPEEDQLELDEALERHRLIRDRESKTATPPAVLPKFPVPQH